ncbi:MAG TPA: sigma-70 family RNA polymerase sigma factor [Steroidobacteraceae bacterium]|jgi:RNA polymerase sigma-70 factor (ECF subfamily)|nr:sigma-70 family RNA polymerase sigma factor [Steroidobacteraceae bacterium]
MNLVAVQAADPPATGAADEPATGEWLLAARAGSDAAFGRLVTQHQARIFSLALRLTGRRDEAEELAQDAFLQLHANLARIDSPAHLRHWLCRTVTHRSIDRLRGRARQPLYVATGSAGESASEYDSAGAAETDAYDPVLRRRLLQLLLQLPEMARAVVVLRFQEDLDPVDIARTLDMPINTVKSHLRRSLDWLRQQGLEADR